jgi:hypothetical protein
VQRTAQGLAERRGRRTEVDEGGGISRCDVTAGTQAAMKLEGQARCLSNGLLAGQPISGGLEPIYLVCEAGLLL